MDVEPVGTGIPPERVEAAPREAVSSPSAPVSPPPPPERAAAAPLPADSGQNVDLFA